MDDSIIEGLILEAFTHYNSAIQHRIGERTQKNINSKIMVHLIKEIIECPICLQTKNEGVITNCGHKFCKLCITRINDNRCPYCRQ
jgi:hypothetical protein